jgi:hypothetical protein
MDPGSVTYPPRRTALVLLRVGLLAASASVASGIVLVRPASTQPAGGDGPRIELGSDMGLARTPFPSPDARESSGLLTSLSLRGRDWITPSLGAQLRLTLILAGVDLPAGAVRPDTTWGHPEASLIWRAYHDGATTALVRIGLAAPIGSSGEAALGRRPFANQSLLLADALRAWRDRELFAPGRLAMTPSARAEFARGRLAGFGEIKAPLMLAVRRGDRAPGVDVNALAISTAVGLGAAASLGRFMLGVAPWLVVDLVPGNELHGNAQARWTLSLAPEVGARITERITIAMGSTIFLAGALQGFPAFGVDVTGTL